jgi:membrane protease YdiL (CAAX protease family)
MTQSQSIRAPIIAILIIEAAALVARSYLELTLRADGFAQAFAKDLSFFVVPPILAILLFPVLRDHKDYLLSLFRRKDLTLKLFFTGIAVGLLMRIAWWSQLVFFGATGISRNPDPNAIVGPIFSFGCPPFVQLLVGITVMAILVPIIEETINRGLIQSSLAHRGKTQAVLLSSLIFAVAHPPAAMPFAFAAGLVMGVQFWNSQTLWFSLIAHSTVNGLIQLDWRCVHGMWSPRPQDLPMYTTSAISLMVFLTSITGIYFLIRKKTAGRSG